MSPFFFYWWIDLSLITSFRDNNLAPLRQYPSTHKGFSITKHRSTPIHVSRLYLLSFIFFREDCLINSSMSSYASERTTAVSSRIDDSSFSESLVRSQVVLNKKRPHESVDYIAHRQTKILSILVTK